MTRNRHTITVAGPRERLAGQCKRWVDGIVSAWLLPACPPDARALDNDSLRHLLDEAEAGAPFPGAVVLLCGPDSPREWRAAAQRLQHLLIPAVLLFDSPGAEARSLQGEGVIVESSAADPALIAAMLYALAERQSAVETLRRELRIAACLQGGVREEMERLHEELNLAALIQQESLPRVLPRVGGLDFGVLFRPAGYVSGDVYAVTPLDDHRVGLFVADAVGHGVPAALLTMVIMRAMRLHDDGRDIPPGEALRRLNEELVRAQRGSSRFATAVCAVIDARSRQVTLACAGHPPPLVLGPRGQRHVSTEGPLLGVFEGEDFPETTFTLGAGETLLLYSDGFETAFPDAGADRAAMRRGTSNYLAQLAGVSWPGADGDRRLSDSLGELAMTLDQQAGSLHQVDDVTALGVCAEHSEPARLAA